MVSLCPRQARLQMVPPSSLAISSGMGADSFPTARIGRAQFHRTRSASKKAGVATPYPTLLRPRVARAEEIISLHALRPPMTGAIYRNLPPRRRGALPLQDFIRAHRPCRLIYCLDSFSNIQEILCSPTALCWFAICSP
jgi:hypothetical protein